MNDSISLIKVYCDGRPDAPHDSREVARMVRTIRMDDTTGWTVAREDGKRHPGEDWRRDRLVLRCSCGLNCPVKLGQNRESRGYDRLVRGLDYVANSGASELQLYALAGIVRPVELGIAANRTI